MKDWLTVIAAHMILVIHGMALLVVAFGTVQAFVHSVRAMFDRSPRPATGSTAGTFNMRAGWWPG